MTHWLIQDRQPTVVEASRGITYPPTLAGTVSVRLSEPRRPVYDTSRAKALHKLLDDLAAAGIKPPKKVADARADLETAETMKWPGLGDLPELPTLVAESKKKFDAEKRNACARAYRQLRSAIAEAGPAIYDKLAAKLTPELNGGFAPILKLAYRIRGITWGQLEYQYPDHKNWKPIGPGDPVWLVRNLESWVADGAPRPTPSTIDGLFTPAEVVAHVAELPTRKKIPPVENSFLK